MEGKLFGIPLVVIIFICTIVTLTIIPVYTFHLATQEQIEALSVEVSEVRNEVVRVQQMLPELAPEEVEVTPTPEVTPSPTPTFIPVFVPEVEDTDEE